MVSNRVISRPIRLIHEAIRKFKLNLNGFTVFTEVGAGHYIFTPFIAALAGAAEVIAIAGDSKYASSAEVEKEASSLARHLGVGGKMKICTAKIPYLVSRADIVTNLGFVRPIDKWFISCMKSTAVIPLMFETWEFRGGDVDLEECNKKGVCVLGTNEEDERLRIFEYLGHLCAKMLFDNQIEVFQSKLIVIGGGKFGFYTSSALREMGANVFKLTNSSDVDVGILENLDAIITADHEKDELLIGKEGYVRAEDLKILCPDVLILNLAGNIDRKALDNCNIRYLPKNKEVHHMGWTLSQLGPKPVVDLHTAGLKVGEILARLRMSGLSPEDALRDALKDSLCQGF